MFAALIAGGIVVFLMETRDYQKPANTAGNQGKQTEIAQKPAERSFDKKRYSTDLPESLWLVINKKRPLEAGFVSRELLPIENTFLQAGANQQLTQLIEAAKKDQVQLRVISGYRSYQEQKTLYDSYVRKDGRAAADTYSARPGFSEHQTGLAADLGNADGTCNLEICFETTPGGMWLAAHAHEYGFIIRYVKDKTPLTGYQFEPWHLRYVGTDLAAEIKKTGQTLEEFFSLPAAPGY